ncbi:MAG: hypothetical protein K2N40_00435, partial [Ureaplasma sp.]|nr:hypothetical protein [Ureaplasma sp.]
IKTIGHFQVISQLKEEIMKRNWPIDKIVIDQFANIQSVKKYLQTINANNYNLTNIELIEHAESKIVSVAAASILARHFFLIEIEKLSKKYLNDEILPLGAWNINIEKQMLNLIEKNGIKNQIEFYRFFCNLVKLHFKNSTKLIKMIEKKYN